MISARLQRLIIAVLLAAVVLAVYGPLATCDFINIDDAEYVKENANINGGFSLASVKWAFENPVAGNWHPVTMLSHMLDCQLYGIQPGRHHLTNVLFHLANTVLLFWILLAMTGRNLKEAKIPAGTSPPPVARTPTNLWPCALVAALFGLHPLHVESVAWISERKDVLSTFFFLLTLWAYARYAAQREHPSSSPSPSVRAKQKVGQASSLSGERASASSSKSSVQPQFMERWSVLNWLRVSAAPGYLFALAFYTLGLMSKAMLVTLPFVLLLLDYWPLGRLMASRPATTKTARNPVRSSSLTWLLLEKAPFLLLAAIFSLITFHVQQSAGAVVALKYFALPDRLATAMVSYVHYLGRTFVPDSLAMLYSYHDWSTAEIVWSTAVFAGLSMLALWAARRHRYIFVGWFWFVGMLVPVIGLVQVGQQVMADRYTYLPLIGIFIALAWGLAELAASPGRRWLAASGAVLAVAVLVPVTARQVGYWKNSQTLFEHTLSVTGHSTVANYILGALYDSQGRTNEALSHFTAAIQDNPGNVKARCGLAYILCGQGQLDEAAEQYQAALRIEPDSAKAHFGLAEVLLKQHQPDDAANHYFLALQANPNIAEAHYQLAALFAARQDPASAIAHLQEAVRLRPDWALALNNLAWNLATQPEPKLRNGVEATRLARQAATLTGGNPSMLDTLAAAYAETGQFKDAVQTAESAIQKAGAAGRTNLVAEIEFHLKSYQSQQAFRE